MATTRVETSSGFVCNIDDIIFDDYRFLKLIRERKEDLSVVVELIAMMLGDDEPRLMAHLAKEDGRIPIADIDREVEEIFSAIAKSKKK